MDGYTPHAHVWEQMDGYKECECGDSRRTRTKVTSVPNPTYTVDTVDAQGVYCTDTDVTEAELANARANAPRMGVTILAVFHSTKPVHGEALAAFGIDPHIGCAHNTGICQIGQGVHPDQLHA